MEKLYSPGLSRRRDQRAELSSHSSGLQKLDTADIKRIASWAVTEAQGRRASDQLRRELQIIDQTSSFSAGAHTLFQDLLARLGVATTHPIKLPLNDQPFWHRGHHPLANYQTTPKLPATADIVVIGAGLTGAAAAYSLRNIGKSVVVLDQGDPAGEASGRNGGNFELIPENSVGVYEGLARERMLFMERCYPRTPIEVLHAVAERQASLVLGLALRNRELFREWILSEGIACDFSPRGWLHIAANEVEEQGICEEVSLAAQHGQRIEIWSRGKIRAEFGIDSQYLGRFIPGDGTYHPFKYVCGLIQAAIRDGVALYTRVRVRKIVFAKEKRHLLHTNRGPIAARSIIVATNAFTRDLLPELSAIEPYQSQVLVTEHATERMRGRIVTSDAGPIFFNQPREGAGDGRAPLLFGGGDDRPMSNPSSRRRSRAVHEELLKLRDGFYPELAGQPPSAEWVGAMAFTPDGLPCIGFMRAGVVVAAGYNGYGGTYATAAGAAAAEMVVNGLVPDWVPEDIFSPRRLIQPDPLFLTERDGLWRVAVSLCRQLHNVNRKISDELTLHGGPGLFPTPASGAVSGPQGRASSVPATPELLSALGCFQGFSRGELRRLVRLMRRWDLPAGTMIFSEGSVGGSCFLISEGEVDVSIHSRGRQQLLATLQPGSVFGQVSLIAGMPRSATCSLRTDTVLLELERLACERLLSARSQMALKFLAVLNEGLISALRGADLRFMQIQTQPQGASPEAN